MRAVAGGVAVSVAVACGSGAQTRTQPVGVTQSTAVTTTTAVVPPQAIATPKAMVAQSAGVTQTAIEAPLPVGASAKKWATVSQVVCLSTGCVATGGYNLPPASNQAGHLLALSGLGEKWRLDATPRNRTVRALACPTVETCVGTARGKDTDVYVVTQSRRSWRSSAVQLPGGLASSKTFPLLGAVSCRSAGNCTAGGMYTVFKPHDIENHPLLVDEEDGTWGPGFDAKLPFDAATTPDPEGQVTLGGLVSVVSCPSAGNCVIGGTYADKIPVPAYPPLRSMGWVATEKAGEWGAGTAVQLPADSSVAGDSAIGVSPFFGFRGLSCPSVGNCTGVGGYLDGNGREQGLIVQERRGVWQQAFRAPVPRGGSAPSEPNAFDDPLFGVSCADVSDCAAIGAYVKKGAHGFPGTYHGWLLSERRGIWTASKLRLPRGTSAPGEVFLNSVSCPSRGNCVAVGTYGIHIAHAFVVVERRGRWQRAIGTAVPANAAAPADPGLDSVSCSSTSRCTAVGSYKGRSRSYLGLIVSLRIR